MGSITPPFTGCQSCCLTPSFKELGDEAGHAMGQLVVLGAAAILRRFRICDFFLQVGKQLENCYLLPVKSLFVNPSKSPSNKFAVGKDARFRMVGVGRRHLNSPVLLISSRILPRVWNLKCRRQDLRPRTWEQRLGFHGLAHLETNIFGRDASDTKHLAAKHG